MSTHRKSAARLCYAALAATAAALTLGDGASLVASDTPTFSIDDVAVVEGLSGTTTATFTVTLSNPSDATHTVNFATSSGTATPAPTATFFAPGTAVPGTGTSGPGAPYPSTSNVAGVVGSVFNLAFQVVGISHTFPDDIDLLLVGPGGQKALVMSDIGGSSDLTDVTLTFRDGAPTPPPGSALVAGTYAPTNEGSGDTLPAPAPVGPYASPLSVFNGTNANGTWSVYAFDDVGGDVGSIDHMNLIITTIGGVVDYVPATGQLIFGPGITTRTVDVTISGNAVTEPNETFFVNLSGPIGALIADPQGVGTIFNDDGSLPAAVADAFTALAGIPATIAAPGVVGNDFLNGGTALSALLVTTVAHGALTLSANGSFTYLPTPGYVGPDSFSYRAFNNLGVSSPVNVTFTVSLPGPQPPTNLYVSSMVGNTITMRFTPPLFGPTPTGFALEGGLSPGETLASIPTGSTAPIFAITAPTGSFFLRMRTLVGADQSDPSNEIQVFVNTPAVPSAPTNLLGLVDDDNVALAWRNTFARGAPTSLVVDVTGSFSGSIPIALTDSLAFSAVPAGTYTLSLRAVNGVGISDPSNAVTLAIPGACSGAPLAPANFLAYKAGSTLSLLWDPATSGPAPTSFVLNVTGSFVGSFPLPGRGISASAGPGTYTFTVQGVNACGTGAPTAVQTVTLP